MATDGITQNGKRRESHATTTVIIIEWTHRSSISLISLVLDLVCRLGICTMPRLDNMYTFVIKLTNNTELDNFISVNHSINVTKPMSSPTSSQPVVNVHNW